MIISVCNSTFQVAVENSRFSAENCRCKELYKDTGQVATDSDHSEEISFTAEPCYTEDSRDREDCRSEEIGISGTEWTGNHVEEEVDDFTSENSRETTSHNEIITKELADPSMIRHRHRRSQDFVWGSTFFP